jgi:hypothetical protein
MLMRLLTGFITAALFIFNLIGPIPAMSAGNSVALDERPAYNGVIHPDTTVSLVYEDSLVVLSYTDFTLPVKMAGDYNISAVSLGIYFPVDYIQITSVDLANGTQGFYYHISDSLFSLAWSSVNPIHVGDGGTILSLHMHSLDLSALQQPIFLKVDPASEFADETANVIDSVVLVIPEIVFPVTDPGDTLSGTYVKVFPNPITKSGLVEFYLESDSKVSITVCDQLGQTLAPISDAAYEKGFHQVPIPDIYLAKGIYLLKFEADNGEKKYIDVIKLMSIK